MSKNQITSIKVIKRLPHESQAEQEARKKRIQKILAEMITQEIIRKRELEHKTHEERR